MSTPRLPSAVRGALAGALFVGLTTAILFALAIAPNSGVPFGAAEVMLAFVMGAVFGTIAGGVAGASETEPSPRTEPQEMRERATSTIARMRA